MQEASGVEITRPCGVQQGTELEGGDAVGAGAIKDYRSLLAAGEGCQLAAAPHLVGSLFKTIGLVEGRDLHFVGKQDVDVAVHQLLEAFAVTLDAKSIRQAQSHLAPMGAGHLGRSDESRLGLVAVPEVTL